VGNDERKRLKRAYKDLRPTGGVFAVTNTIDGKTFLGSCLDAERPLRRIRFELDVGSFRNQALQDDYSRLGVDAFRFEVLETVSSTADDPEQELESLEAKYLADLDEQKAYNTGPRIRFR